MDRAPVAEPQEPGPEPQAQGAGEITVVLGFVGRAFERVGILGVGVDARTVALRRRHPCRQPAPGPYHEHDDEHEQQNREPARTARLIAEGCLRRKKEHAGLATEHQRILPGAHALVPNASPNAVDMASFCPEPEEDDSCLED